MALFCVGNSHLEAVRQGAANLGVPLTAVRLNEMTAEGKLPASAGLWRALEDQVARQKPPRIVCLVGGGNPARIGLAQHPEPFDFVLPWRPDLALDPKAEPVPYDAVRALIEQRVKKHLKSLDRIRALGVPLIQLESPPPLFDNDAVLSFVIPSLRKDGKTEAELANFAVSGPYLRYKTWSLHSSVIEAFCRDRKIDYRKNPPAAHDPKGFLRAELAHDFVHGNAAYGALVLSALIECRG